MLHWEESCLKLSREACKVTGGDIPEKHLRTLVADLDIQMDGMRSPSETRLKSGYQAAKLFWRALRGESIGHNEIRQAGNLHLMQQYMRTVEMLQGRTFFSTMEGYLGRGPADLVRGDIICVFYSGNPLFVLRLNSDTGVAKFIGDAYVCGAMVLAKLPRAAKGKDEIFIVQ
jgi:hypothetical protein